MKQYITLLIFTLILLSCGKKTDEEKHQELVYKLEKDYKNGKISEQELFFRSKKIIYQKDIQEDHFNAIKKGFELHLFDNKSLCQYYQNYKEFEFKSKFQEADEVIKPLKEIKNLDHAILINGYMLCPAELDIVKIKTKIYNERNQRP